jgi:hypothetical protein
MDTRHHLLVAFQWITYPIQIQIGFFHAQSMACYQKSSWGYILNRMASGDELAIIIIFYFDVWTIMDKRHHLLVASQWITYPTQVRIVLFDVQSMSRYQDSRWGYILRRLGSGDELAIIIIVYFDVWTIMDKRHHLLVASQWITYPTQVRIVLFGVQSMSRYQVSFWGYILRLLDSRWWASKNHNILFWRMNDHG